MAMTIDELRGLLQPSQDDQQQTRGMGLLSMGAGILANNRGNYGAFGPAVGAGVQQGLNTYQDAQKTNQNNRLQQISMQMKLDEYQQQQEAAARKLAWQNSVPTGQTTTTQIPSATQAAGLGLTDPSIPTPMNNGLPQLPQTRTTTSQPTREELNNWIVKGIALDPSSAEHAAQVMRWTKPEAADAPDYNKPFNTDGTPNKGYQEYELKKASINKSIDLLNFKMQNGNPLTGGNLNINGLSPDENKALDNAINNGLDPYKINSRTAKIYAQQEMLTPGRKWNSLGAQASFERSVGTTNTKALLNTITPLLDQLVVKGKALNNSGSPIVNTPVNFVKKNILPDAMGGAAVTGFDNFRDDTIAEVERGLMGTGVLSDSKYLRALKNLNSSQTDAQRQAAVNNIKQVIQTRLESLHNGPNAGMPTTVQSAPASNVTTSGW